MSLPIPYEIPHEAIMRKNVRNGSMSNHQNARGDRNQQEWQGRPNDVHPYGESAPNERHASFDRRPHSDRSYASLNQNATPHGEYRGRDYRSGQDRDGNFGASANRSSSDYDDVGSVQGGSMRNDDAEFGFSGSEDRFESERDRGYGGTAWDGSSRGYPMGGYGASEPRRLGSVSSGSPQYPGKGPKGYSRSDDRIREDVCDRLSEGHVDASGVEVSVREGIVTLTGSVPEKGMKRRIEDLAEGCRGVKDVENQIRVNTSSDSRSTSSKTSTNDEGRTRSANSDRMKHS